MRLSFNSLQTGRYMERSAIHRLVISDSHRFNSLQTGRYRESDLDGNLLPAFYTQFQFPSNGKVHGKPGRSDHS